MEQEAALAVLVIEGRSSDHPSFAENLDGRHCQVTQAPNGTAGLKLLDEVDPNVVVVDAASLRTSGVRICQSFRKADSGLPIILIVDKDTPLTDDVDANLVLKLPFTVQKLINRLRAYQETEDKFIMKAGPIALNTKTQLVSCHDRQTKLTPKLVSILQILMKNKGKVVGRNPLFTKVWKTDYTGDTRTLDVHISWLRQAIEEDPSQPKLILTKHGEGYLLDVSL